LQRKIAYAIVRGEEPHLWWSLCSGRSLCSTSRLVCC
jgi:hypothetical protein